MINAAAVVDALFSMMVTAAVDTVKAKLHTLVTAVSGAVASERRSAGGGLGS